MLLTSAGDRCTGSSAVRRRKTTRAKPTHCRSSSAHDVRPPERFSKSSVDRQHGLTNG